MGSVKTNFGHLLSAAGIASFIKVILSIQHRQLPPTLHCDTPNPRFNFSRSPFYINTQLHEWIPREGIRQAGVSSFGLGGTNAHIIVSEYIPQPGGNPPKAREPLPPVVFNRKRYWLEKPIREEPLGWRNLSANEVLDRDDYALRFPDEMSLPKRMSSFSKDLEEDIAGNPFLDFVDEESGRRL